MRNMIHIMPFMLICFSVVAYKDGVPTASWHLLESAFILFDKQWIEDFLAACTLCLSIA